MYLMVEMKYREVPKKLYGRLNYSEIILNSFFIRQKKKLNLLQSDDVSSEFI